MMYIREILPPRDSLVEKGNAVQGTWDKAFKEVDLLGIRRPFNWPLPRWLRALRIKEWESFCIQDDRVFIDIIIGNFKLCCFAQVLVYVKDKGEKYIYRKLLPGNKAWQMSQGLGNTSVSGRLQQFLFYIHNWLDGDTIKLAINVDESQRRAWLGTNLEFNMGKSNAAPMAVSFGFSEKRGMYAYKAMSSVQGVVVLGPRPISLDPNRAIGIFCDYKGYFPYLMKETFCCAMGYTKEGQKYGFHIGENQIRENYRNNENVLWIDGKMCPLPPVRITMSKGADAEWIIQDIEGMVDLEFTPKEPNNYSASFLLAGAELNSPLGYYNGMLLDSEGSKIIVRNLYGIGHNLYLRL